MDINVVTRKMIKPCTPTPQNLNKYQLSLTDELSPPMHVGVLLFYPPKQKPVSRLEESLAKILAQFYPLAGRYIKKDHLVDCSDQGAEFVEAEAVDVELIDLVGKIKTEHLNDLLPHQYSKVEEAATDPLLSIQVTEFKCGGLAMGISVSHRIFDAASVETFIVAWSNANNPGTVPEAEGSVKIRPSFDSTIYFPGKNQDYYPDAETSGSADSSTIVVKRFFFSKDAIIRLKSRVRGNLSSIQVKITRVRVVSALITKALISVDRAKYGQPRACVVAQAVNIRGRTIPPLPKHLCGNLAIQSITPCMSETETKDIGIQELVYILGDAISKTIADCVEILSPGEDGLDDIVINPVLNLLEKSDGGELNVLWFSDWSKFQFYGVDFGWGKPVWAGIGTVPGLNVTVLMDSKERDGIEAWVHLNHKDISYFEQDEDIRLFTTS